MEKYSKESSHNTELEGLIQEAWAARTRAYAPYSKFQVGAALETDDGEVFAGANIENISFGLTICAERTAASSAVLAGRTNFRRLVIVADTEDPISPCGACRQFLAEFAPSLEITSATQSGLTCSWSLTELLPRASTGILQAAPASELEPCPSTR